MKYIALALLLFTPLFAFCKERFKVVDDTILNNRPKKYLVIKDKKTDILYVYKHKKELGDLLHDSIIDFMIWNIPVKVKYKDGTVKDTRSYTKNWIDIPPE